MKKLALQCLRILLERLECDRAIMYQAREFLGEQEQISCLFDQYNRHGLMVII
jgi:hypothetical protein